MVPNEPEEKLVNECAAARPAAPAMPDLSVILETGAQFFHMLGAVLEREAAEAHKAERVARLQAEIQRIRPSRRSSAPV